MAWSKTQNKPWFQTLPISHFWICVHYAGPNAGRVVRRFDKWNYVDPEELAGMKLGIIAEEDIFHKITEEFFTGYFSPLIPWMSKLCRVVFPDGGRWKREDEGLYSSMKGILHEARKDAKVLSDT